MPASTLVQLIIDSIPNPDATRLFFQLLHQLIEHLNLSQDDERLAIDYRKKYKGISVNINSRLVLAIRTRAKEPAIIFMIPAKEVPAWRKKYAITVAEKFKNKGPKAESIELDFTEIETEIDPDLIKHWLQICQEYLPQDTKSPFRNHHIKDLYSIGVQPGKLDAYLSAPSIKYILVNITWNSNDWQGISKDKSGHKWVNQGNTPHESWNFDLDNPRNPTDAVYGFAQFTHPPKVTGNNNVLIFYSQDQIVGFYGRARVLETPVNLNELEDYNLIGDKSLSLVLENKIEEVKEKGFLEGKQRIGQIGFGYIQKKETVLSILKEALRLNPDASDKINALITWVSTENVPSTPKTNSIKTTMQPLNQILYGPPGTGKTYTTIEKSIHIVNPAFDFKGKTRKQIKEEYERLQKEGLIEFVTFHQSMTYEDFIEGIKPIEPKPGDTYLKYEIKPGIFKRLVAKAQFQPSVESSKFSISENEFQRATFYKISLGNTANPDDDQIYQYCIDNDYIGLGWGGAIDFTGLSEEEIQKMVPEKLEKFAAQEVNIFIHYLKQGDYVVVSYGNLSFRAIGIVTGDYIYRKVDGLGVNQFRKVRWLLKNQNIPVEELYYKQFQQQTLYKLNKGEIRKEFFVKSTAPVLLALPNLTGYDELYRRFLAKLKQDLIGRTIQNPLYLESRRGRIRVVRIEDDRIITMGENANGDEPIIKDRVKKIYDRYKSPNDIQNIGEEIRTLDTAMGWTSNYFAIFKALKEFESALQQNPVPGGNEPQKIEQRSNYVLIIDEINRGNISQIFGELITLIEEDKRKGRDEQLELTLPYSGERFSVPDNIYILGTMNTADRSVEALDTALRRRFSFIEMQADIQHESIDTNVVISGKNFNFREILATINKRLEKLIGRDHQIGHSYFIAKNGWGWENYFMAFNSKIIPLLQEYFYSDYAKMCLVVGKGFVNIDDASTQEADTTFFAAADHEALDSLLEKQVWRLQPITSEAEFANALNLLLNK